MNTSTQVNARSGEDEHSERRERTIKKIAEALGKHERRQLYVSKVDYKDALKIVDSVPGGTCHPTKVYVFDIDNKSGLISVKDAIRVAKIASDSDQPDPRAMRILTEYLEEEWATFRLADVHREVAKYDANNPSKSYVPRCMSCGLPSDTSACVPCRKALARTLANLDVALALFVKEEVSIFRIESGGMSISVGDVVYPMWQSGGLLGYEHVNKLCGLSCAVPYNDQDIDAFGMMTNHLNAGARKAHEVREAALKDMMSSGKPEAVGTVTGGGGAGCSGGEAYGVQGGAFVTVKGGAGGCGGGLEESGTAEEDMGIWNPTNEVLMEKDVERILKLGAKLAEEQKSSGFDAKTAEAIRKASEENPGQPWRLYALPPMVFVHPGLADKFPCPVPSFETGEASWPHCIDKDGNVSGDLLDTLYEFYERMREKFSKDEPPYPNVPRKNFWARKMRGCPGVVVIGVHDERGRHALISVPWDMPTKSSILATLGAELGDAVDLGQSLSRAYATMLSIFQDMFAPKDDSALWGSSCD